MRLVKPNAGPPERGVRHGAIQGRPDWFKEWIARKARYVLLTCRHKEDMSTPMLTIVGRKKQEIWCYTCNDFSQIEKAITLSEYMGFPPPEKSDVPLF